MRGERQRFSSFVIRRRVIFSSSARTTRPFGILVVVQPGPEPGQHLLAGKAAGADQEDMAEPLLVGQVAVGEALLTSSVAAAAPDCSAADIPPRAARSPMRGCPFMLSAISSQLRVVEDGVDRGQQRGRVRVRAAAGDGLRERRRRAAGEDVALGVRHRGGVEGAEGRGRLRARVRHTNIQPGPAGRLVAARRLNRR